MSTRSTTAARWAASLSVTAALFTAGAAPALAEEPTTYTVELRQPLPRTATSNDGAAPQQGADQCPGIPDGQDGWHFVLPGNSSEFVTLTVTFEPGGQQVVTDFGPPSDKHAYVASAPGAQLTSAVAEVEGGELEKFNLSHTCPASTGTATTPPATPTSPAPTGTGSTEPTGKPTDTPTSSVEPSGSTTESAEPVPGTTSTPPAKSDEGGLAATGAGAIGLVAGTAVVLLGAGAFLYRRMSRG